MGWDFSYFQCDIESTKERKLSYHYIFILARQPPVTGVSTPVRNYETPRDATSTVGVGSPVTATDETVGHGAEESLSDWEQEFLGKL